MKHLTNEQLQAEVAIAGCRLVPADHFTELEVLTKRIDGLARESHASHEAAIATKESMDGLANVVVPLLNDIRHELANIRSRVTYLEQTKGAHAATLLELEAKDAEHDGHITDVFRRLVIVEESIKKRKVKK